MGGDSLSVPILYEANATDFNNLGLGPLVDTIVATVTEERNGQFILEMQYPVDGIRASLIAKNRILKVDAGHKLKDQRFVIKRINRIMGNDGLSYSIYAEHISYITADYALKPNLTISGSGNVAMTQWLNGIIDSNRIHVDSDITTENTTNWTIDKVQNARQALGGVQGSILDVWGGEYRFDNLNISLLRHRGTVSNTLLSYGRNITDFDQEENITNTYTSIYPFASYSVQNGDTSEQKILTIPDLVVDSEYVKNFPNRKIQVVDFSDKFNTDETPTVKRLTELAKSYIKNNNVGIPTVSTKISFVDLSKTENYKEFAPLEELDLCDEVPFAFEKFGIKTTAKISRIVWNVLLDSYDSLELGELKTNLSDVINNTNNAALDAKDAANDAKNSADNAALSANGKNRNWYGADDPAFGHLSELREGDSWYKPNGEDTEVYHWINGQWVFILSTKDAHEAKDAADTAQKEAEEAKKKANESVATANDAVAKAGFANDTAEEAKSDATTATQNATTALTNAGTALTNAKNALDNVTKLDQTVKTEVTNINGQLSQKVNQTTFDTLKGTVTSQGTLINQNKDAIKLKADQTYVDTIKGTVANNTAAIDLNSKEIKLKASQSDVNKLSGRVTNTESQIKVQADQIAQTVSKTELTTKLNGYATQTWTQSQIKSTADQINLSVSKVQSNLDNMQVAGVNYLRNSNFEFGNANWRVWSPSTPPTGSTVEFQKAGGDWPQGTKGIVKIVRPTAHANNSYGIAQDGISIVQGREYVVSFESASTIDMTFSVGDSGNGFPFQWFHVHALSHQRTQIVFKAPAGATKCNVYFGFNGNDKGTLWISRIMMSQGNKSLDWGVNPADYTSEVQFSQLQVTVNGIQGTVQNKADKSQVTQLANQITSTVSQLGTPNYVYNPGFAGNSADGWGLGGVYYMSNNAASSKDGVTALGINLKNIGTTGTKTFKTAISKRMPYSGDLSQPISASVNIRTYEITGDVRFFFTIETFADLTSGRVEYFDSNEITGAQSGWRTSAKLNAKPTKPFKYVAIAYQIAFHGVGSAHGMFCKPMMNFGPTVAPYTDSSISASQITQLSNDINLRVEKNKIVNQINISPEGILIDGKKVHITGLTRIDNAVIKDAMIADVKADKITAGTLNAAHVNVINLNANNITTGTLKGADLSMNLNTGEVVFQHGRIHSASNNVDINIDQGYLSVANANTRVLLKDGGIQFVQPTIFDHQTNPYLDISNSGGAQSFYGASIVGRDFLSLANSANNTNMFTYPLGVETFAGISFGNANGRWNPTKIGGAERGIVLSAGTGMPSDMFGSSPSIIVGANESRVAGGNRIALDGEYVHIPSAYSKTASGSANVIVATDGALVRSTSATKYKTDIIRTNKSDYGDKLLNLPTATWMDLADIDRYEKDPVKQPKPTRNFGMIAEDLADVGLEMLVVRGTDGELEGINYDRIGPALIPVIAKLKNEVGTLKRKLEEKTA